MKANYTLEKVETEDGFAATYLLMCDGYQVGSAINIPDIVKGAKIISAAGGREALVINVTGRIGRPRHIKL